MRLTQSALPLRLLTLMAGVAAAMAAAKARMTVTARMLTRRGAAEIGVERMRFCDGKTRLKKKKTLGRKAMVHCDLR